MRGVLTPPIGKTSTCLTLPSLALTRPRSAPAVLLNHGEAVASRPAERWQGSHAADLPEGQQRGVMTVLVVRWVGRDWLAMPQPPRLRRMVAEAVLLGW